MSANMEDALTEALLWLQDEPLDNRLTGADFGKNATAPGYWWTLRFTRDIKDSEVEDSRQDNEKRVSMVVAQWCKSRTWLDKQGSPS